MSGPITTTEALANVCARAAEASYVTVDTEFLRERTYYSQLCLVQLGLPPADAGEAVTVDPLAPGIDLAPLWDLMIDPTVVKVFHAARQDLEIFWTLAKLIPQPFFDTQVAAMVCGFGEQVGYEKLVSKIARAKLDKSSRFTDWSRRPLSAAQLTYALADVTHLRTIYEWLAQRLEETGRRAWVEEEVQELTDPATYVVEPWEAWRRVKTRTSNPRVLAVVRELARFREERAQATDVPRARILKDDALMELASARPQSMEDLSKSRLLQREGRKGDVAEGILAAIARGLAVAPDALPRPPEPPARPQGAEALAELLRVLLKAKADEAGVAPRLIASASDLDEIASGEEAGVPALMGWRRELFGEDALRLCQGRIALSAAGNRVRVVEVSAP